MATLVYPLAGKGWVELCRYYD